MQQQAADYYASYMDDAGIEAKGLAPLQPMLARIAAIDSHAALSRALGEELRADVDALNNTNFRTDRLFGVWVTAALDDPATSRPYLLQGGLDLPDREYYLEDVARAWPASARSLPRTWRARCGWPGVADADAAAAAIVALETKMARVHATRAESLDVLKANNPWKRAEFPQKAPGLDWDAFLAGARLDTAPVIIVWHPSAVRGLSALVRSEPLASWKHWLTFHAIDRNAAVLPKAFVDERFAFHGKVLNGTPQLAERWKRGIAATSAAIPRGGRPDLRRALLPARNQGADAGDGQEPHHRVRRPHRSARVDVGGHQGEGAAEAGDAARRRRVSGYVGRLPRLADRPGRRLRQPAARRALRVRARTSPSWGSPVDKGEWWMSPQTVNALNLPLQNALNFPAAILAPPYFDPAAPAATNYGAIGAVIGHEITHSFDDQRRDVRRRRPAGELVDEGGPRSTSSAAGARLAAQYDAYAPFPDLTSTASRRSARTSPTWPAWPPRYDGWRASLGGTAAPRDGRLHRPAAVLPRLRPGLADQVARAGAAPGRSSRTGTRRASTAPTRCATSTRGTTRST